MKNTYGSLAEKDVMITSLWEIFICRAQTRAMQKVNSKISVAMSSAVIACQRGNLFLLVESVSWPVVQFGECVREFGSGIIYIPDYDTARRAQPKVCFPRSLLQ